MNKVFVVKEKDKLNSGMVRCYTGVMSNWGPEYAVFNQALDANKFVKSFLRKEGNSLDDSSYESIIKGFLNYLKEMTLEEQEESEAWKESEKIKKDKKIKSRFDILDL